MSTHSRCEPMTVTGDDGEPIEFRAQVHGDLSDADREAIGEIVRSAVRTIRAQPRCPECEHRTGSHVDGTCVVRVREDGHGRPCGCVGATA